MSELTGPSQAVLVTTRAFIEDRFSTNKRTRDNIMATASCMQTSQNPALYAISIAKQGYSSKLIKNSSVFALNFMPYHLKDETIKCSKLSGEHIDKFKEAGLSKTEAATIDCPLISEAIGHMECEVINEIETGDQVIFIGKALRSELKRQGKRLYHIDLENLTTTE
ncbi:MAG: flavin reductase family protein [Nanoarchaeota archaeon]|nr:flavin reductase family protein [Nanoarchaeota archaeon]MCK5629827.1 flavin reductase family protein [Nanoarchaeota archaeon]